MVARKALPDQHHVMRYAAKSKRFHHPDTGMPMGPSAAAFGMRDEDEGGLSVTEIEFFGPNSPLTRGLAAAAYRDSQASKKLGTQAIFSWALIGTVKQAAEAYGKTVRVVHAPVAGNPAHAEVRHFTYEDLDLLAFFASDVFLDFEVVAEMDIPAIG